MPLKNSDGNPNSLFARKPQTAPQPTQDFYDLDESYVVINDILNETAAARDVDNDGKVLSINVETDPSTGTEKAIISVTEVESKPIEVDENEIPKGDGDDWVKKSNVYVVEKTVGTTNEFAIGPKNATGSNQKNLVLCGNPDTTGWIDGLGFNSGPYRLRIADNVNINFTDQSKFLLHDKAAIVIEGFLANNLTMNTLSQEIRDGIAQNSRSPLILLHDAATVALEGSPLLCMRETATINMDSMSLILMRSEDSGFGNNGPGLIISDGSEVWIQGKRDKGDNLLHSPLIIIEPEQILINTTSSTGITNPEQPSMPTVNAPAPYQFFEGGYPENPIVCFTNKTSFVMQTQSTGKASALIEADGSTFIHFGSAINKELYHREQNSNIETFDFMLRASGPTTSKAWEDSGYHWREGNDTRRPISQNQNGPLVQFYDRPVVTIRGIWDASEFSYYGGGSFVQETVDYTGTGKPTKSDFVAPEGWEEPSITPTKFGDLSLQLQEAFIADGLKNYNFVDLANEPITYQFEQTNPSRSGPVYKSSFQHTITLTNAQYTVEIPDGWVENPSKVENSPLVQIIENSQVKLSGSSQIELTDNFTIKTGDNGFEFSDGTNTETLTVAEITQLKALLNP